MGLWNKLTQKLRSIEPTKGVLWTTIILVIIGLINVYSATVATMAQEGLVASEFFKKQAFVAIVSISAILLWRPVKEVKCDYTSLKSPIVLTVLWLIGIILLVVVLLTGSEIKGATRWIQTPIGSFQPSEYTKVVSLITTAYALDYIRRYRSKVFYYDMDFWREVNARARGFGSVVGTFIKSFWMIPPIIYVILIVPEKDLGGMILNILFPIMMAFYGGAPLKQIVPVGVVGFMAMVVMIVAQPYRLDRVKVLLDPFSQASSEGYQTVQSILAVYSGQLKGVPMGQGLSKYAYLPEHHTDFAFAVFAEEWGFVGVIVLIGLFTLFAYFGMRIARNAVDLFGSYLAFGVVALISFQAVYNMLMIVGSIFVTGVPMPFISYGSSALLMNIWAVSILLSVGERTRRRDDYRRKQLEEEANRGNFAPPVQ